MNILKHKYEHIELWLTIVVSNRHSKKKTYVLIQWNENHILNINFRVLQKQKTKYPLKVTKRNKIFIKKIKAYTHIYIHIYP